MCFEVLGFDIFLDADLKPYLLEVNHDPSFETDSPLDFKVKKQLISDAIKMLNLSYYRRVKYKLKKQNEITKRSVAGKKEKISKEDKEKLRAEARQRRDLAEAKIQTSFTLMYPSQEFPEGCFSEELAVAQDIYEETTGKKDKNRTEKVEPKQPPKFIAKEAPKIHR